MTQNSMWEIAVFICLLLSVQNASSNELSAYQQPAIGSPESESLAGFWQGRFSALTEPVLQKVLEEMKDFERLEQQINEAEQDLDKRTRFSAWGGKRAFSSWGGKRDSLHNKLAKNNLEALDALILQSLMDHENGRSKRGYEVLEAGVKQPDERRGVGFSSWGGKRNPGKIFGLRRVRSANLEDSMGQTKAVRPVRAAFSAWGGKR